ncbi:hypothetical protein CSKR_100657, partial [Clonorchis sinensis]
MPPEGNTRTGILPGCPSLDRKGQEAQVGFEPRTFQSDFSGGVLRHMYFDQIHSTLVRTVVLLFWRNYSGGSTPKGSIELEFGTYWNSSAVHIQWLCRDLNPGLLKCEASVLPPLHQRTLDASEFSRLNRQTCSLLSD